VASAPRKLYRVKFPFQFEDVPYPADRQVYAADHPILKTHGGNFEEVSVLTGRVDSPKVEQATADPGEKR
jgi:hypothetical protein